MKLVKFKKRVEPVRTKFIDPKRFDVTKDGVNASLLGRWLGCREKARLYLDGWTPRRIGAGRIFGIIAHGVQDNIYSDIQNGDLDSLPSTKRVNREIDKMEKVWKRQNPKADADTLQTLELNLLLAAAIMPAYFKFWHEDLTKIDWMSLEHKFKVPIGNTGTHLIGRMDGNFQPVKGKKVLWLFETKTKSRLGEHGESNLVDILPHELQTNLYLGAMVGMYGRVPGGLVLNIIRRPNFKQKKNEGPVAFAKRVEADVKKRPEYYFIRIRMTIDKNDLQRMQNEHAQLVQDFVNWSQGKGFHYRNSGECENKYGTCEYLKICANGDYVGMYQREPRIRKEDVEAEG